MKGAQSRLPLTIDLAICLLMSVPLVMTAYIPLLDLPNHLAQQYIYNGWSSSPFFQKYYRVELQVTPNLGFEIFVFLAHHVMSIDMAVRLFCITTLWSLFWGTRLVNRQLSPASRIYRAVPILVYGGPFQFGFLSYCLGVGLALLFFGAYLRLRDAKPVWLCVLLWPLGFALLLCHLAAFGLAAISVGAFELARSYNPSASSAVSSYALEVIRRAIRAALIFGPPFLIFFALEPASSGAHGIRFATLHDKLEGIAALTVFSSPMLELTLLGLAVLGSIAAVMSGAIRIRWETITIAIAMGIVYLLLPRVGFGGGYIDYRIPWGASFFVLATLVPGERRTRTAPFLAAWFGLLAVARIASIAILWLSWAPTLDGIVSALKSLPNGARLIAVEGVAASTSLTRSPALVNVPAYAVAYRQVLWLGMFADFPGQLLHFQKGYKRPWQTDLPRKLDRLDPLYNFVLVMRPLHAEIAKGLALRQIGSGQQFELFAVTQGVGSKNQPGAHPAGQPAL